MTTAQLNKKKEKITPEMKAFIAHTIREILDDPDYGLELKPSFVKKLRAAQRSKGPFIPMSEVKKKYL